MIYQKDGRQVGKTIYHYSILEKLGESGMPSIFKKYNSFAPHEMSWRTGPLRSYRRLQDDR